MKNRQKVYRLIIFVFAVMFIVGGSGITANAKKKGKCAKAIIDKTTGMIQVKYNGATIATTAFKPRIVYAKNDILFVRRGPGKQFRKVKKIKFDMGSRILRIGKVNSKWSIVQIKGKRYFISNKHLSLKRPKKKLSVKKYTAHQLKWRGVIHWNGWRWTWYSQKVLRGKGLHIPGRHVDTKGFVCDKKGYICLASGRLRRGTVVKTPFGKKGKVYDSGCGRGTLDVYTNF